MRWLKNRRARIFHFIGKRKYYKEKTQRKTISAEQKSVLKNALKLYDGRTNTINAFVDEHFILGNIEADIFDESENLEAEPLFEESISERTKKEDKKNLLTKEKLRKDKD